jgi:hypothetical protein
MVKNELATRSLSLSTRLRDVDREILPICPFITVVFWQQFPLILIIQYAYTSVQYWHIFICLPMWLHYLKSPIPVAERSKAWVCGRSFTGIVGSKPAGGHGCLSIVSVVCCQVEVSASGWSLVQRSPTKCGVSKKCDREGSRTEAALAIKGLSSDWK